MIFLNLSSMEPLVPTPVANDGRSSDERNATVFTSISA